MNPGAASESCPEYRTTNIDDARMLLIAICEINSVCELQKPTGSVNSWIRKSTTRSNTLAELGTEEALRPQHQHQEEGRKGDTGAHVAAQQDHRQHLDRAQEVTTQDGPGDAAHPAEHDHREAADLDAVTADVAADVAERDPEQDAGQPA